MQKGAETEEGTIYATEDEHLLKIARDADAFHNDEFQPQIKKIYDLKKNVLTGQVKYASVAVELHKADKGAYEPDAPAAEPQAGSSAFVVRHF